MARLENKVVGLLKRSSRPLDADIISKKLGARERICQIDLILNQLENRGLIRAV